MPDVIESISDSLNRPASRGNHRGSILLLLVITALVVAVSWPSIKGAIDRDKPLPPDRIGWGRDYNAALSESAKTGKPVLIDFFASWCGPCVAMEHDVWPDDQIVAAIHERFVPLKLDADRPEAKAPGMRYSVDSIPRILIVDSDGQILRDANQYMSVDDTLHFLRPIETVSR